MRGILRLKFDDELFSKGCGPRPEDFDSYNDEILELFYGDDTDLISHVIEAAKRC